MSQLPSDFPAAHSMDTTWYAIDKHGHVAMFDSGEDGAVPSTFSYDRDPDWELAIKHVFANRLVDFYVDDLMVASDHQVFQLNWEQHRFEAIELGQGGGQQCLLWFESKIPKSKTSSLVAVPNSKYCLAWAQTLDFAQINQWIESGSLKRVWFGVHLFSHRSGVFTFDNDSYGGYPYVLSGRPVDPILVSQLPEKWQKEFGATAFADVDFQITRAIQPLEHFDCEIWGPNWIDMNGVQHEDRSEQ